MIHKLSIIIPVFNEEKTLHEVIKLVKNQKLKNIDREIIVVDDGSTDNTLKVLEKEKGIRIYYHSLNQGKGAALSTGFTHALGDILIIQDADLEYNPKYYNKLLKPILSGKADVVYGTRLKHYPLRISGKKRTPLISHFFGNKLLSMVTSILFGRQISDMETGFKVFKKEVIKGVKFESKSFDFEPEFTAKVLKRGFKVSEVPIKTLPRGYNEGKKITWVDGFIALKTLIKFKFFN